MARKSIQYIMCFRTFSISCLVFFCHNPSWSTHWSTLWSSEDKYNSKTTKNNKILKNCSSIKSSHQNKENKRKRTSRSIVSHSRHTSTISTRWVKSILIKQWLNKALAVNRLISLEIFRENLKRNQHIIIKMISLKRPRLRW